jgi:hypothetical protein
MRGSDVITLPRDRLPADPNERAEQLRGYFGDLIATATLADEGWQVLLARNQTVEFYVDPALAEGLAWWGPEGRADDIHKLLRRDLGFQLSLDDSWTLYDWSLWLSERRGRGEVTKEVVILHVDDHTDFMPPRVARDGRSWTDLITGEPCDLGFPESVRQAILSGAVGIGSFMAPFLHGLARCEFRHLSQSVSRRAPAQTCVIALNAQEDTLLKPAALRPSIGLQPYDACRGAAASHRYVVTHSPEAWLSDLPPWPMVLHIDMDYFNNRFDRDSGWREAARPGHDPDLPAMTRALDELFAALGHTGVGVRIESIAVALSPGFFPAEFWSPMISQLTTRLGGITQAKPFRGNGGGPP